MQYCTQCGTVISSQAKFCPSCGLEMSFKSPAVEKAEELPGKMEKGVVKSLQETSNANSGKQFREAFNDLNPKGDLLKERSEDKQSHVEPPDIPREHFKAKNAKADDPEVKPGVSFWIWIYMVFNLGLGFLGYRIQDVIWVLVLSLGIILGTWIRKGKLRPYNWFIKILIIGQMILLPELLYSRFQYMVIDAVTILLGIILMLDIMLLFRGNRK